MIEYILSTRKRLGTLKDEHKIIKTIVTSDLHAHICKDYKIEVLDTLTGFKWIADVVNEWERQKLVNKKYLFGTEESFGYMPGDYVRDKDGIRALCQTVEMSASFKSNGMTHCQQLLSLFGRYGAWQEDLITIDLEGEQGAARIGRLMNHIHNSTPAGLCQHACQSNPRLQFANQTKP